MASDPEKREKGGAVGGGGGGRTGEGCGGRGEAERRTQFADEMDGLGAAVKERVEPDVESTLQPRYLALQNVTQAVGWRLLATLLGNRTARYPANGTTDKTSMQSSNDRNKTG